MLPSDHRPSVRRFLPLIMLWTVQGCERFAFAAMLPLFLLYAQDRHAIAAPTALLVLAIFQALSYLSGLPAGWLADRRLGAWAATALGAALLACGYGALALDQAMLWWPALAVMVVGHSLFKPSLHVLIGSAAGSDEGAQERAFLWHYLAVNLAYVTGGLFGEWAHARHGWATLFFGAAIASAASGGLVVTCRSWMRGRAARASTSPASMASGSGSARLRAVWLLSGVAVIFWLTAQQAGGSLMAFATTSTVRQVTIVGYIFQMGPGHFASLHGLMVLALLPAFLALHGRRRTHATSTVGLMLWGYVATAAAFLLMSMAGLRGGDTGRVSGGWLAGCYLLLSLAEVLLAPLGVSLLTRLAPKEKATQAVGLGFAGCAVGNSLAGVLGLCWDRWPHHRYFGLLSLLSLGAAAILLPRRRRLDWLTAQSNNALPQAALDEQMEDVPSTVVVCPGTPSTTSSAPSPARLILAAFAIVVPGALVTIPNLPLVVHGISAIVSGLAVLICGSYLLGQALEHWARRSPADPR